MGDRRGFYDADDKNRWRPTYEGTCPLCGMRMLIHWAGVPGVLYAPHVEHEAPYCEAWRKRPIDAFLNPILEKLPKRVEASVQPCCDECGVVASEIASGWKVIGYRSYCSRCEPKWYTALSRRDGSRLIPVGSTWLPKDQYERWKHQEELLLRVGRRGNRW